MEPQRPDIPALPGRTEHRLNRWRDVGFYTDVDMSHLLPGQQRQIVQRALARIEHRQLFRWLFRVAGPLLLVACIAAFSLTGFLHLRFFIRFQTPFPTMATLILCFALAFGGVIYTLSRVIRRLLRPHIWRALDSLCSACGYDLTANTSGVCPECGREIERKSGNGIQ